MHLAHESLLLLLILVNAQHVHDLYDAQAWLMYVNAGLIFERSLLTTLQIIKNEKIQIGLLNFKHVNGVHVAQLVNVVARLTHRTILDAALMIFTTRPIVD